ncbi:hypothetical protein BDK51DRAFT_13089, partial [Blyttiomyces helicus]
FYVIDVPNLKHPAGKPRHLDARFSTRPDQQSNLSARRRADFLEDRRSKLARRTSHVRAVCAAHRLRETRDVTDKRTRIAETLETAERNRRSILEAQVRSCADAVAHAKEVARTHAMQSERARDARRATLEARLRETSVRRQRLLTTPRSRLLEPATWDSRQIIALSDEAALAIQQWWRRAKLSPVVREWAATEVSLDWAIRSPFDAIIMAMRNKVLINTASSLLRRLAMLADPAVVSTWKNPARVFLSAYMIVAHPSELMPTVGPLEKTLMEAGESMLHDFEAWVNGFATERGFQLAADLVKSWTTYYDAFEDWKAKDSKTLVDGMIAHFMELERLWLSVKDQVDAETEWRPRIHEQQEQLYAKINKLGKAARTKFQEE